MFFRPESIWIRDLFFLRKFELIGVLYIRSFLFYVEKKRTKETPLKEERVSFRKKRTCRIFLHFNILSALKDPPLLRAHPSGAHERGFVNRLKEIAAPASRTVAVISFEIKL